jgi:hypothetical protein
MVLQVLLGKQSPSVLELSCFVFNVKLRRLGFTLIRAEHPLCLSQVNIGCLGRLLTVLLVCHPTQISGRVLTGLGLLDLGQHVRAPVMFF